ncbi:MAG: putative histidine kinase, CheA [Ramlibacter sp.]|jgi:chemosensory pili system protein ChpA (sensor histidine kinase/response regulator)|nr:putative histidine kinase, CheA [Ramlibacter sp.]
MQVNETDLDLAANDLGPLAWVLDELRKSLDSASAALRRFVRDANLARGSDMASVDDGQLRIARQQLHQAVGALEMVGMGAPAHMLRGMEAAVQKFVERPELCSEAASAKLERAGFALTEYLEGLLLGKPTSAVALFPQYRDVQELAGADRVHPADLWTLDWRWVDPQTPAVEQTLVYDPAVRGRMDQGVLSVVKTGAGKAARDLVTLSLGLAASQPARQPRVFWKIAAGYFEALAQGLLPMDLYVKRAASRILMQYATLAKGEVTVSDRLAQDLVFFCSQAVPARAADAPALTAVRLAWSLARFKPVDYQTSQFGRFDPMLLAQARKRITTAKETWSSISGGDANKVKSVSEQFRLVTDSLVKLHPPSAALAQALNAASDGVARSARPPGAELAMEVATAILYLEAAFEDLDPTDSQLAARTTRLAERLDGVRQGGQAQPLETWMEELYRRVSDRQTMGSVVGELRTTLGELEKLLDNFFRNPQDKGPLRDAPGHLSQMRGVLSVLGLDQASQAVLRMRETVEEILIDEVDEEKARAAGTFDKLGNNLGALGFLIDMLNYQPALAKKLFVYDDQTGELRPLMGRAAHSLGDAHAGVTLGEDMLSQEVAAVVGDADAATGAADLSAKLDTLAGHAALAGHSGMASSAREAAAAVTAHDAPAVSAAMTELAATVQATPVAKAPAPAAEDDFEEDDLRDIFLEEAREVVQNGLAALKTLEADPSDLNELTTLRRAFHTLKGSSRMVGLNEFGEAGWSMEQVLNAWLAEQKPASEGMRALASDAMRGFALWVEDIAAGTDGQWKASAFRVAADAMRTEQRLVPLVLPGSPAEAAIAQAPLPEVPQEPVASVETIDVPQEPATAVEVIEFDLPQEPAASAEAQEQAAATEEALSFELPEIVPEPAVAAAAGPVPEAAIELPDFSFELIDASAPVQAAEPVEQELSADLAAEFGFDLGSIPAAPAQAAAPVAPVAEVVPTVPTIEDIDLDSLIDVPHPAPRGEPAALDLPRNDFALSGLMQELAPLPDAPPFAQSESALADEQAKVIGTLRIGIPLYNVYLNEADEWSRRLETEVSEWALELNSPLPDSTVGLAHALAGSSATVGFDALSDVARALESALGKTQLLAYGKPQHGAAFTAAAEEIRRLLHQFAAGFLKESDPKITQALHGLQELDVPKRAEMPDEEGSVDVFSGVESASPAQPVKLVAEPVRAPQAPVAAFLAPAVPHAPVAPAAGMVPPQAVSTATRNLEDEHDSIDVADAIDPDLFSIFEEEAGELLPQLGGALRQWVARPDNRGARDEVLRALHTLKGSARLAGALRLGEMSHRMESEIEQFGMEGVQAADLESLLQRLDALQANLDQLRASRAAEDLAALAPPQAAEPAQGAAAETSPSNAGVQEGAAGAPAAPRNVIALPAATMLAPVRQAANHAVRVRSQLLDRLVNQAGEVMITRSRLEAELKQLRASLTDLSGNLDRLRSQLRDIELQAESQMQSRLAQAKDSAAGFDPLEFDRFTRVQELTRMMAESVNDVATVQRNLQRTVEATEDDLIAQARQTRELQRDLLRTRMVEFEGISDRLYRVVRQASKDAGKQVKLDITGGSIEMDRGVLDRMTPAFEHLLRNCVAHGIEAPEVRLQAGKEAAGTIVIGLSHEGNDVSVQFDDDGAGLNIARIREKAMQQGLIAPGQEISDQDAANLIFMPGFSTATQVTELAGRGIGMDVVRAEVNALGGRIETRTLAGKGTSFKLVLPLTTAVTQVVMIRSGTLAIGVPANLVELVRRAPAKEVQQAYNSGNYEFGGESLPFFWSGALLQASQRSNEPQGKTLPVVIFRSAAQRIAVHVDEVLGNQEVVVKNLGPQLARLPGLAGMTVLASGAVVLIYNPVALTAVYGELARQLSADNAQPEVLEQAGLKLPAVTAAAPQIPLVLVVDDSITVRRVTQRLLAREGYRVALAADGLQALAKLAEELPAVVLSDIEMPRMDGFDLARNIRGDERLAKLPIIMITSRIAEKHREHARALGVDHYLGKPYSEEELLSLVKHYCAEIPA